MAKDSSNLTDKPQQDDANPAADVIRRKLAQIYAGEPLAKAELQEAEAAHPRSKHQEYMYELSQSGKSFAEVQTAWHDYYVKLPDAEKHQVWQEFYESNQHTAYQKFLNQLPEKQEKPSGPVISEHQQLRPASQGAPKNLTDFKSLVQQHVANRTKLQARQHLKSLAFGLSAGFLVIVIFLFSFFNQFIITPFIQPSRHVSNIPLIVDSSTVAPSSTPEVIIPKINVEIPVNYSVATDNENSIENALEGGVVHYPSTVLPGQNGNAAFFGHSSNNIFNPGKYKFAFVLLHTLVKGDTFYLTYNGKVYVYQVIDTKIVPPNDVSVLNDTEGKQATATLITCDPPGTSINRLVVTGQQISPSVSGNTAPTNTPATAQATQLAGNGPSLWSRFWHAVF